MDELLKKARESRENAIRQRDELNAMIQSLDEFIARYTRALTTRVHRNRTSEIGQADLFSANPRKSDQRQQIAAMMDATHDLIIAAGRPLTRSELLTELQSRGFQIEGGDKSKVLGTNLWRSRRFDNLKGAGYWPKSVPLPAQYVNLDKRPSALE